MAPIDIIVSLSLLGFAVRGYQNGLVHELLSLAIFAGGFFAAFKWTPALAPRISDSIPGPAYFDNGVAFVMLFGLVLFTGRYLRTTVRRMWLRARRSPGNRVAGLSFGIFKGAVIIGCTILFLRSLAPDVEAAEVRGEQEMGIVGEINTMVNKSYIAARLADLTGGVFSVLMSQAQKGFHSLTDEQTELDNIQ